MAVPWDPTQHIQGIAQGLQSANQGIQDMMPGDEITQGIIDGYLKRRNAGIPKETAMSESLAELTQRSHGGSQMPTPNTPDVGMQNGVPALGTPGQIAPTPEQPSSPPNSFTGMTPQGLSNPSTQMQAPAAPAPAPAAPQTPMQPGGLQEAAMGAPMPSSAPPSAIPEMPVGADNMGTKTVQVPSQGSAIPSPAEYATDMPSPGAARMVERPTKVSLMNRGQQNRAMSAIAQADGMDSKTNTLQLKEKRLLLDTTKALLNSERLTKKDIAEVQLKMEGLDQKGQIEVLRMYIQMKQNEAKNGLQSERNDIARKKSAGSSKMPWELKNALDLYRVHANEYSKYIASMTADDLDPREKTRLLNIKRNAQEAFNSRARALGVDPMDAMLGSNPSQGSEGPDEDRPDLR